MAELLDAVITAHGGLDRWNAVRSIDVTFNFSGGHLDLKGFPGPSDDSPAPSRSASTAIRCLGEFGIYWGLLGCGCKAARLGDGDKITKMPKFHARQVCPLTCKVLL
jgi:hypothetical protein